MQQNQPYDVVIIGSGLGGLLCATLLAKEGMKVCVLEKNKQYGGCLQTFALQKQVFDSCVHYIGGLGEGHPLNRLFTYIGIMDKLTLKAFDPNGFDRICFGKEATTYPLAIGSENFIEQLTSYFPQEREALRNYIEAIHHVGNHFPLYRLRMGDAQEKSIVSGKELTATLHQLTNNPRLQQVLLGNNLLYAGMKGKTPFYQHALVSESYIHSAHKVLPGSSQITKYLMQELRSMGGELFHSTEISQLVTHNDCIEYATTKEGLRFYGKQFIANIHPEGVVNLLDTPLIKPVYRKRIQQLPPTISPFMVNLVLRPATIPMQHYNTYWHLKDDALAAIDYLPDEFPATYAAYYTESTTHKGYAESVSLLTYMHASEVAPWAATYNTTQDKNDRDHRYQDFKALRAAQLIQRFEERVPGIQQHIMAQSAATPLTFRDYTGTPQGALYGIQKDVGNPAATTIATRTKLNNLLLTGQNINLHGVLGVSLTAIATCAELLGMEYILEKIKN